jgi:hypothetical protein
VPREQYLEQSAVDDAIATHGYALCESSPLSDCRIGTAFAACLVRPPLAIDVNRLYK